MREPLKDRMRLEHMKEAIDNVFNFTENRNMADFRTDKMLFYAVVKNLEIIGEAAYRLTKMFRKKHADTEWDSIIGLRHVLVHDYYQVNYQTVWEIVHHDLSPLNEQILHYINDTDWSEWEKDEAAVVESAVRKSLIRMVERMKWQGYGTDEICKVTGLSREEIEEI